jgi:hypothetical protein
MNSSYLTFDQGTDQINPKSASAESYMNEWDSHVFSSVTQFFMEDFEEVEPNSVNS